VSRTQKFFPGWKMTWDQHNAYFWYLSQVYAAQGLATKEDREEARKLVHLRAFGHPVSARDIDHLKMYDAFKAECLAILKPADVDAQVAQVNMPLTRLRLAIRELADEPYWQKIALAKYGTSDLDELDEDQLTKLRNTLAARSGGRREPELVENPF
jgi:hypothetical protein